MTAIGIHAHDDLKLGLAPLDPVAMARMIRLDGVETGLPVDVPPVAEHLTAIAARFVMGSNNRFGTCGPTSIANLAILIWHYVLGQTITVTDAQVQDLYRRSGNPNFDPETGQDDNGVDMHVMLSALMSGGLDVTHMQDDGVSPDHHQVETITPVCYAGYDSTKLDDIHAVTYAAGGSILAAQLQTAQQEQSQRHPPLWAYEGSGMWGGHAFMGGAYQSPASMGALDESVVSWQMLVGTTDEFFARQLDFAGVVVWRPLWDNDTFAAAVDRRALAAAYEDVTGRPISVPTSGIGDGSIPERQ